MELLAKHVANSFVLSMTARQITQLYQESIAAIGQGNFKLLDIVHHLTAGMKATATEMSYIGLDEMRQSCGGAGFLLSSGIANIWAEQAPVTTFEGVNVVMFQQSARLLLKNCTKVNGGKQPQPYFAYLATHEALLAKNTRKTD